jgi:hypothetical protein
METQAEGEEKVGPRMEYTSEHYLAGRKMYM